jgi:hypothetical protein
MAQPAKTPVPRVRTTAPPTLHVAKSTAKAVGSHLRRHLTELAESLQQLHRSVVVQLITLEFTSVEALKVRRENHAFFDKKNDLLPIQRHRSINFD